MGRFIKTLLAGAALGALLSSLSDPEKRKKAKAMLEEIQSKVKSRANTLGSVSREAYEKMVDATVSEYKEMKGLTSDQLRAVGKELKAAWEDVKTSLKK